MRPEFLCHLPFLRLPPDTAQALADDARIGPLPFEEWLALEDPALRDTDRRYRAVAPVFVRAFLPAGGAPGELTAGQEQASADVLERAHTAAMLAMPATPLAPPALSAAYVAWRGLPAAPARADGWFGPPVREPVDHAADDGLQLGRIAVWLQQTAPGGGAEQWVVERRFGPAQREWLLARYAAEADAMDAAQLQAFAAHYARLTRARWGPRRAAATRCADVVATLGRPGTPLHETVVLFVAALENIVNAGADRPLGDTFARRCAAWFAENPAERVRDTPGFRRLYGARSDILHGEDPAAALQSLGAAVGADDEQAVRTWLRLHAWLAVDQLAGWYATHPDDDGGASEFRARLAAAAAAPDAAWQAQRQVLLEGRSHVRG